MNVEEKGARGVAQIGGMDPAAGDLPEQPGVDGATGKFPLFGPLARSRNIFEQPGDFGSRKIGVGNEAGTFSEHAIETVLADALAHRGRAPALPDDGAVDWFRSAAVPKDDGLALVRDADGGNLPRRDSGQHALSDAALGSPDLAGVVLHPAWLRVVLREFLGGRGADLTLAVEENGAGTGGALVEGKDVVGNSALPLAAWR
jgi:hypothetical protein